MARFAKLDENNVVLDVIVVDDWNCSGENGQESEEVGIAFLKNTFGENTNWKKTSVNTVGGVHYDSSTGQPSEDQSKAYRKNCAGQGMVYDEERDAFRWPQPYASWTLNENTCQWEPPTPPTHALAVWNEETQSWDAPE
jgi:hypothetical protein